MLKNLLSLGITLGLADREKFVSKVSGLIEQYQENPEKADEWAKTLVNYLEQVKDDIRVERTIQNSVAENLPKAEIEKLTRAIEKLTAELEQKKKD